MSILSVSHCTFASGVSGIRPGANHTVGLYGLAVFDRKDNENMLGCVNFPEDVEFDLYFRMSRIAGATMASCMTATFLILVRTIVFIPSRSLWNVARAGLSLALMASVLTFAVTSSDHCKKIECTLSGVGIVTVLNCFIVAGLNLIICIEPCPTSPWFVWWTEEHFIANRDTLALGDSNRPEFASSHDIERSSQGSAQSSALSEQFSVQDSLVTNANNRLHRFSRFRFGLLGLIFVSWILSILGIRNCTFVLIESPDSASSVHLGVGLYTRSYYVNNEMVGCIAHSEEEKDNFGALFHISRVFGAVSALLMSAVLLVGTTQLFTNLARVEVWLFVRLLLPCVLVAEALTGLIFYSDLCTGNDSIQCVPGGIGYAVMGNLILLFILSVSCCLLPTPSHPAFARWRAEEEEADFSTVSRSKNIKSMLPASNNRLGVLNEVDESEEEWGLEGLARTNSYLAGTASYLTGKEVKEVIIRIETSNGERKIVKEITHQDGTKTITTNIEELHDIALNDYSDEKRDTEPYRIS
eukprot:CAMPEP_0198146644 /NCGR_PEP_ID=MMETSP1443-20131203/30523_1 /TAXON_ID=186043 /ORGANISM="Entomoneis sp., Strain CCMP2396" /LENGTH=525 /DNA_ID=CAMNT_0043810677 /DNA_START=75 /DNA_END=1652 /DNA_ORIENTATION=+